MGSVNYKIVLVEDHGAISKALSRIINSLDRFSILYTCSNGLDILQHIQSQYLRPDIILMDVELPIQNGIETTKILTETYPNILVVAISMHKDEERIIEMLKAGARGYLPKDCTKEKLENSLSELIDLGFCHRCTLNFIFQNIDFSKYPTPKKLDFASENEVMIKSLCEPLKLSDVAQSMEKSIEEFQVDYDLLIEQLHVKNRIGVLLFAKSQNWI